MPIFIMPQLNITFFLSTVIFLTLTFLFVVWIHERTYLPTIARVLKTRSKVLKSTKNVTMKSFNSKTNNVDDTLKALEMLLQNIHKKNK